MDLPRNHIYTLADMLLIPYEHQIGSFKQSKDNIKYFKIVGATRADIAREIVNSQPTSFYRSGHIISSFKQIRFALNLIKERGIFLTELEQIASTSKVGPMLDWLQQKKKIVREKQEIPDHHEWKRTTPSYPAINVNYAKVPYGQ